MTGVIPAHGNPSVYCQHSPHRPFILSIAFQNINGNRLEAIFTMASIPRPGLSGKKTSTMRPPTVRPSTLRAQSATPALNGRTSPAESVASVATNSSKLRSPTSHYGGTKRKEREFEQEGGEETNINVVVRCRGRNDREVRENSGVVVSTNGIKGSNVELSMGPSALSNKTYHFDKVFSPAADQSMVFDEVVAPILDEVSERERSWWTTTDKVI